MPHSNNVKKSPVPGDCNLCGPEAARSLPQRLSLIEVDVAPDAPVEGVWRHWEPRFLGLAASASLLFALYLASKMSLASATDIAIAAS